MMLTVTVGDEVSFNQGQGIQVGRLVELAGEDGIIELPGGVLVRHAAQYLGKACSYCLSSVGQHAPSHNGSARCESRSIASGGSRSHCTCDTCW